MNLFTSIGLAIAKFQRFLTWYAACNIRSTQNLLHVVLQATDPHHQDKEVQLRDYFRDHPEISSTWKLKILLRHDAQTNASANWQELISELHF